MCKLVTNATILLKTRTLFVKDSIQDGGEGDMWLVKSACVNIQACHKRTILLKTRTLFVRSVALGSEFMKGASSSSVLLTMQSLTTARRFSRLRNHNSASKELYTRRDTRMLTGRKCGFGDAVIDMQLPGGVRLLLNQQQRYVKETCQRRSRRPLWTVQR